MPTVSNFLLPLPFELEARLRQEAEQEGKPATTVVREALESWLTQRGRQRRHEELAAWAAEHAGSSLDLDEELERAALEALAAEPPA